MQEQVEAVSVKLEYFDRFMEADTLTNTAKEIRIHEKLFAKTHRPAVGCKNLGIGIIVCHRTAEIYTICFPPNTAIWYTGKKPLTSYWIAEKLEEVR